MTLAPVLVALLGLLLAALVGAALIYRKLTRIHLATYQLLEHASATRRETEAQFSQIQALLALEKKLGLTDSLPPLRGWAGSPDFLLAVADEALSHRPRIAVECSSGSSTVVLARCLQINGDGGRVYSLEHDPVFAEKTRSLLERHRLTDFATVLDAPLIGCQEGSPWYALTAMPNEVDSIDLLVIDGPPSSTAPLARYPAFPILRHRLAESAAIMIDDASRPDEVEMVARWMRMCADLSREELPAEKGLVVLRMAPRHLRDRVAA